MSKFPLDIVNFDEKLDYKLDTAIIIANSIQDDFVFSKADRIITQKFKLYRSPLKFVKTVESFQ